MGGVFGTFLQKVPRNIGFLFSPAVFLCPGLSKKKAGCGRQHKKKSRSEDQLSLRRSTLLEGHFGGFLLGSFGFFGLLFRSRSRFAYLFFFQAVDVNRIIMAEVVGVLQFCDFQGDVIFVVVFVGELQDVGDFQVDLDDFEAFDFLSFSDVVFYKFFHGFEF